MLLTIAIISFLCMMIAMILAPSDKDISLSRQPAEIADGFAPAAQM